ncbi:Uncharacterised protein [Vibrio cholerae]|nr:Uncharacterised protein [Vibrio cholerae]
MASIRYSVRFSDLVLSFSVLAWRTNGLLFINRDSHVRT